MTTSWLTSHTRLCAAARMAVAARRHARARRADDRHRPSRRPRQLGARLHQAQHGTAHFPQESYRPGETSRTSDLLVAREGRPPAGLPRRAGAEAHRSRTTTMNGVPVSAEQRLGTVGAGRSAPSGSARWPSGVYFARLDGTAAAWATRRSSLRPRTARRAPRRHRHADPDLAGVQPSATTTTTASTTPGTRRADTARPGRPYLNRGVPFHYKQLRRAVPPLDRPRRITTPTSSPTPTSTPDERSRWPRAYSADRLPGHHEYVTDHEYDAITQYRDLGGNLMFLSANNFFWKIDAPRPRDDRVAQWRDLGRPEAALIGEQYFHNDNGERRGTGSSPAPRDPVALRRHRARHRDRFSSGGIEADADARAPPGVRIVAEIPNLFPGFGSAQMTYYERGGAKVFLGGRLHACRRHLGAGRQPAGVQPLGEARSRHGLGPRYRHFGSVSRRRNANHTNGSATRICPTPIASSTRARRTCRAAARRPAARAGRRAARRSAART